MIEKVTKGAFEFDVFTGVDIPPEWEGDPNQLPEQLIKFSTGDDLSWTSFEEFWCDYGMVMLNLDLDKMASQAVANAKANAQHA